MKVTKGKNAMNYRTVVDKIGGGSVSETARRLNMPFSTVNSWRLTGKIPHWREVVIRATAQRLGVNVDVEQKVMSKA